MKGYAEECAEGIIETVPLLMREIRGEMRRHRTGGMTVPQFRSLVFIRNHPGTSLNAIAEHLGFTSPSVSVMMDSLEKSGFVVRKPSSEDRRKVEISLREAGVEHLGHAQQATVIHLTEKLAARSSDDIRNIRAAMEILKEVFKPESGAGRSL